MAALMGRRGKRLPEAAKASQEAFEALGEGRVMARVLGALLGRRSQGIQTISERSVYGPATVRLALRRLEERGWIRSELLPSEKRGRRPVGYTLVRQRGILVEYYSRQARRRITRTLQRAQPW
jgi:DNA-binding MarR family transcriptional regulator